MAGTRILVCGGRDFEDYYYLAKNLNVFRTKTQLDAPTFIIGYDPEKEYPPGADKLAYKFAKTWGIKTECYPYHYHLGKAGGSSRNQEMIDKGKPDLVVAFPTNQSRGTWDMVRRANKAKIKVLTLTEK